MKEVLPTPHVAFDTMGKAFAESSGTISIPVVAADTEAIFLESARTAFRACTKKLKREPDERKPESQAEAMGRVGMSVRIVKLARELFLRRYRAAVTKKDQLPFNQMIQACFDAAEAFENEVERQTR